MGDMVRKQIYISRRQQTLLKRLAKEKGTSEAEIVRQAIDREAMNALPKSNLNREEAWERLSQFILSLRELILYIIKSFRTIFQNISKSILILLLIALKM